VGTTQRIIVGTGGELTGLHFKRRGVDISKFGKARVSRVSEILWQEERQAWCVQPLAGDLQYVRITMHDIIDTEAINDREVLICACRSMPGADYDLVLCWEDYEQAVAFEVAFVQWCLGGGKMHLISEKSAPINPGAKSE